MLELHRGVLLEFIVSVRLVTQRKGTPRTRS